MLRKAALAYLLLLAASHAVRLLWPVDRRPDPVTQTTELAGGVQLAWREFLPHQPDAGRTRLPIVLLHGSPGSSRDFRSLGPALANRGYRVLAPDLPGFGASTLSVPDYSIQAHADYALEWLTRLGMERFHLVGFSMGGGVALSAADRAPDRVASLTLLSSIGVQEFELLGDYSLNHSLHGLQLAGLWLIREGFPHFGRFDGAFFGVAYARNFYDTDQRPLRGVLTRLQAPLLILHGEHDILVPVEAARLHHALVPGSQLQILDRNHFFVFGEGEMVAERVTSFLEATPAPAAARAAPAEDTAASAAAHAPVPAFLSPVLQTVLAAGACVYRQHRGPALLSRRMRTGGLSAPALLLGAWLGLWLAGLACFGLGKGFARVARPGPARLRAAVRSYFPVWIFGARLIPFAWLPATAFLGWSGAPAARFLGWSAPLCAGWAALFFLSGSLAF